MSTPPPILYCLSLLYAYLRLPGRHSRNVCWRRVSLNPVCRSVYRTTKWLSEPVNFSTSDSFALIWHVVIILLIYTNTCMGMCVCGGGISPNLNVLQEIQGCLKVFSLSHLFEILLPSCFRNFIHRHTCWKKCWKRVHCTNNNYNLKRKKMHTILSFHWVMFPHTFQFFYIVCIVSLFSLWP